MYWVIHMNSAVAAAIISLNRFIGNCGSNLIVLIAIGLMGIGALFCLVDVVMLNNWIFTDIVHWLDCEYFGVRCGQTFDSFSAIMLGLVTLISLVVYIYSMDYLSYDPFTARLLSYLLIFTFLMLVYVTADNLLQAFVGSIARYAGLIL
jgi:NADH:ubiquinone oxidoreductase subunit 5 (subunit L)/multisubunit Na+/H+ antiporter MnhA subunit